VCVAVLAARALASDGPTLPRFLRIIEKLIGKKHQVATLVIVSFKNVVPPYSSLLPVRPSAERRSLHAPRTAALRALFLGLRGKAFQGFRGGNLSALWPRD
jgi:hypothetical protein